MTASGRVIANRVNALKPETYIARLQNGESAANRGDSFTQKRQAQLQAWRQNQGHAPLAPSHKVVTVQAPLLVPGPAVPAPGSLNAVLQNAGTGSP